VRTKAHTSHLVPPQAHWFDNMLLATRTPRSHPPLQLHRAALAPFAEDAAEALRAATVVADGTAADGGPGCVHDLTYLRAGVVALLVNATNRSDPLWPQVRQCPHLAALSTGLLARPADNPSVRPTWLTST
jgi:hypothetical protein